MPNHFNNKSSDFFTIKSNDILPRKGRVLIAAPLLRGKYFSRSVVLLADHNEKGTMGFVLNKSLHLNVNEMVDLLPQCNCPLYLGGPVNTDHLFFIHSLGELIPESYALGNDLYWGGNLNVLYELLDNRVATPQHVRFFTGYAGWSSGQLAEEMEDESWLVSSLNSKTILQSNPKQLWKTAVNSLGKEYEHWHLFPMNPSLN